MPPRRGLQWDTLGSAFTSCGDNFEREVSNLGVPLDFVVNVSVWQAWFECKLLWVDNLTFGPPTDCLRSLLEISVDVKAP